MEEKRIELFQGLKSDGNYTKDYNSFIKQYFSSEATVKSLWEKLINSTEYTKPLKNFFGKYACDLFSNSTYCGGTGITPPPPTNTTTPNIFACLLKDTDLKLSPNKQQVFYVKEGKRFWTFFNNNRWFEHGGKVKGTWSCKGSDEYVIKSDNGKIWDSSVPGGWKDINTTSPTTNTPTKGTPTNLKAADIAAGKTVSLGMTGQIVGDIQQLLIDKGFANVSKSKNPDNSFGNRTQRMVKAFQAANGLKDDGVVGKDTWKILNDGNFNTTGTSGTSNTTLKNADEVPGSDAKLMQESRKKILRNYLLKQK